MTRRGGTSIRATRRPVVVLAGEDANDRKCLRVLLEEFCPATQGRIVEINSVPRLRDATKPETLRDRVDRLRRLAKTRAAREEAELACVFVHEDFDRLDGDEADRARERVQAALDRQLGSAHYVLAVEEMEAWLLLFPRALAGTVSGWTIPRQRQRQDTGKVADPKKALMTEVSRGGRRYQESDAATVLAKAVELGEARAPAGTNRSWGWLLAEAERCGVEHLSQRRIGDGRMARRFRQGVGEGR